VNQVQKQVKEEKNKKEKNLKPLIKHRIPSGIGQKEKGLVLVRRKHLKSRKKKKNLFRFIGNTSEFYNFQMPEMSLKDLSLTRLVGLCKE
jgi:hypothetical protein